MNTFINNINKHECLICYDYYNKIINTKCNHFYCISCYNKWFIDKNKDKCPYCRNNIFFDSSIDSNYYNYYDNYYNSSKENIKFLDLVTYGLNYII